MSRWTIIPVRGLASGKSRLAATLGVAERQALNRLLLDTVLDAVAGAEGGLARCIVAAGAEDAAHVARQRGAQVIGDAGCGDLNGALEAARQRACTEGATSVFALVADLPAVTAAALATLFAAVPAGAAALVADKHGVGTTGLLLPAPCAIEYSFGENSLARHGRALRDCRMPALEWTDPALAFDLDTPADYRLWRSGLPFGTRAPLPALHLQEET